MDGCQLTCELFDSMLWCSCGMGGCVRTEYLHHRSQLHTAGKPWLMLCSTLVHLDAFASSTGIWRYQQCWLDGYNVTLEHGIKSMETSCWVFSPVWFQRAKVMQQSEGYNLSSHEFLVFVGASSHLLLLWSWGVMVNRYLMPAGEYTDALAFI